MNSACREKRDASDGGTSRLDGKSEFSGGLLLVGVEGHESVDGLGRVKPQRGSQVRQVDRPRRRQRRHEVGDAEVECEVPFPIRYGSVVIATAFRVDMVIDRVVLVENKSVQSLLPVHEAQLLTYLRLSGHKLGFLINWNVPTIREGLKRIAYRL